MSELINLYCAMPAYSLEAEYLESNLKVMGYAPKKEISQYPYVGMSKEEYDCFVKRVTEWVVEIYG